MIRLLLFVVLTFVASIFCVSLIKVVSVYAAEVFYDGKYHWSYEDVRFILIRGSLMAFAFCVLGLIRYVQIKKNT